MPFQWTSVFPSLPSLIWTDDLRFFLKSYCQFLYNYNISLTETHYLHPNTADLFQPLPDIAATVFPGFTSTSIVKWL